MRSLRRISQVPAGDLKSHDRATRNEWGVAKPSYLAFDHSSKWSLVTHSCGDGLS